jgi:large subunit ribosomal protein L22
MEAHATLKYARTSPQKARLVCRAVSGKRASDALNSLNHTIKKAIARDIAKLVKSAVANMQEKYNDMHIDLDELKIKEIFVNKGPVMKRFRPRAQGRVGRIIKPTSHITVVISD